MDKNIFDLTRESEDAKNDTFSVSKIIENKKTLFLNPKSVLKCDL